MPTVVLTDVAIKALQPPPSGQVTFFDKNLPGFGIRVSQGGTKSFVLIYGEARRRMTIGRYPLLSLAQARAGAKRILAEQTLGIKAAPLSPKFTDSLAQFLEASEAKNRQSTVAQYRRHLSRHFKFGDTSISNITTEELLKRINRLRDTPSEQHHAYVAATVFFNWCVRSRLIERSPLDNVPPPRKMVSRTRVLSETELTVNRGVKRGQFPVEYRSILLVQDGPLACVSYS